MAKFLRCFSLVFLGIMTACGGGGISSNNAGSGGSHASVVLQSVQVVATNKSFPAGVIQQFTASGSYSDGTTKDLTTTSVWSSSNASVATITASGMAKGVAPGTVNIIATQSNLSGSLAATVASATLTSMSISLATPSVTAGLTDQVTATGKYSDGSTQNLSSSVAWTVSNPAVASISNTGLVTGKTIGSSVVTATLGSLTGTNSLSVTSPLLVSILVSPSSASVGVGFTDQVTATGSYSDGSTQNLSNSVNWGVSNSALASISSSGLVSAVLNGPAIITATSGSITGTAPLTITVSLVSIIVTPAFPTIAPGTAQQFKATGTFTDGSTQDVTGTVNWSSSESTQATIISSGPTSGLAHALAATSPSSTITASYGSISASTNLTVSHGKLTSIAVTPATSTIPLGVVQQFVATGAFDDGTTQDITNTAVWTSSQPASVSITVSGAATARNLGQVNITATSGTVNGSTQLTVNAANIVSMLIKGGDATIARGTTTTLRAIGTFNDGSTRDVTSQATWTSSNQACATILSGGRVHSIAQGQSTITATLGSQTASINLTVSIATIVSISVTPSVASIAAGTQVSFTATGTFSDSSTQIITSDAAWTSSDTTLATVSSGSTARGIAMAVVTGSVTISATFSPASGGSATGSAQLNVTSATPVSIALTPSTSTLAPASTLQYTAIGTFSDGSTQNLNTSAAWATSSGTVATVTQYGQITGQSPGLVTITASLGGTSGTSNVLVESSPLTSITVIPSPSSVPLQIATPFTAVGSFADGSTQDLTIAATWTSSDSSIATVSNIPGKKGEATGVALGTSTISAVFFGQVGASPLTITNATLVSINITPANPNITLGSTQYFVATGVFSDGSAVDLSTQVAWSSSDATVAVITSYGLASSAGIGTTTVTASLNGVSDNAVLTVQ